MTYVVASDYSITRFGLLSSWHKVPKFGKTMITKRNDRKKSTSDVISNASRLLRSELLILTEWHPLIWLSQTQRIATVPTAAATRPFVICPRTKLSIGPIGTTIETKGGRVTDAQFRSIIKLVKHDFCFTQVFTMHAMHYCTKCGFAVACRSIVCPSVCGPWCWWIVITHVWNLGN